MDTPGFKEGSIDFMAGSIGGSAGVFFGQPFDTIKVRQQTFEGKWTQMYHAVGKTIKHDGPRGFFKGMAFPFVTIGAVNAVLMGTYGNSLRWWMQVQYGDKDRNPRYYQVFLAGGFAGVASAFVLTPVDLIKVKLQYQTKSGAGAQKHVGPLQCLKGIYSQHGVKGCMHGLQATILREIPGCSVYFLSFRALNDMIMKEGQKHPTFKQELLTGGLAGAASWLLNIPFDVVKSRIQADDLANPKYRGYVDCIIKSFRAEGYMVFWRGLPVALLRAFLLNAVTLATYSSTLRHTREWCGYKG